MNLDWINSGQFTFSCSFGMIVLIISIIPLEPSWLNDSLCSDSKLNRKLDFLVQVSLIWFRLKFHSSCHQFRPEFPLHFGGGFLCFENDLFSPLLWYRSRFHFDFEMQFHWLCNCVKCQQKSNWFQLNSLNFFFLVLLANIWNHFFFCFENSIQLFRIDFVSVEFSQALLRFGACVMLKTDILLSELDQFLTDFLRFGWISSIFVSFLNISALKRELSS